VHDTVTGKLFFSAENPDHCRYTHACWNARATELVLADESGGVQIWSVHSEKLLKSVHVSSKLITHVSVHHTFKSAAGVAAAAIANKQQQQRAKEERKKRAKERKTNAKSKTKTKKKKTKTKTEKDFDRLEIRRLSALSMLSVQSIEKQMSIVPLISDNELAALIEKEKLEHTSAAGVRSATPCDAISLLRLLRSATTWDAISCFAERVHKSHFISFYNITIQVHDIDASYDAQYDANGVDGDDDGGDGDGDGDGDGGEGGNDHPKSHHHHHHHHHHHARTEGADGADSTSGSDDDSSVDDDDYDNDDNDDVDGDGGDDDDMYGPDVLMISTGARVEEYEISRDTLFKEFKGHRAPIVALAVSERGGAGAVANGGGGGGHGGGKGGGSGDGGGGSGGSGAGRGERTRLNALAAAVNGHDDVHDAPLLFSGEIGSFFLFVFFFLLQMIDAHTHTCIHAHTHMPSPLLT
jgi:hypothetical protein